MSGDEKDGVQAETWFRLAKKHISVVSMAQVMYDIQINF